MCKYCESQKPTLYQYTRYGDLYFDTVGEMRVLKMVPRICPAFSECSAKDMNIALDFAINYCPECGRALRYKKEPLS